MFRKHLCLLFAVVSIGFAQEFRATLTGRVSDPSGSGVPGAKVNAVNIQTNAPCTDPAWQLRGPFTLRTSQFRTGRVRQPNEPQWDLSVNKRFHFTEQWSAQFRFEMFKRVQHSYPART
jgi:hypothetical protein